MILDLVDEATAAGARLSRACEALMETFWRRGLDFSKGHEVAGHLAYAGWNKPLYGFMRKFAHEDTRLQDELNRGLIGAVERGREGLKAVSLCLWAGADPWAQPRDEEDEFPRSSAVRDAVLYDDLGLLKMFRLKAGRPDFQELYEYVGDFDVYEHLAAIEPPVDPPRIVLDALCGTAWTTFKRRFDRPRYLAKLFESGLRLERIDDDDVQRAKTRLLEASEYEVKRILELLKDPRYAEPAVLMRIMRSATLLTRHGRLLGKPFLERMASEPGNSTSVAAVLRKLLKPIPRRRHL